MYEYRKIENKLLQFSYGVKGQKVNELNCGESTKGVELMLGDYYVSARQDKADYISSVRNEIMVIDVSFAENGEHYYFQIGVFHIDNMPSREQLFELIEKGKNKEIHESLTRFEEFKREDQFIKCLASLGKDTETIYNSILNKELPGIAKELMFSEEWLAVSPLLAKFLDKVDKTLPKQAQL